MYLLVVVFVNKITKGDPFKAFLMAIIGLAFIQIIIHLFQLLFRNKDQREDWIEIAVRLIFLGLVTVFFPLVGFVVGGAITAGSMPYLRDMPWVSWANLVSASNFSSSL